VSLRPNRQKFPPRNTVDSYENFFFLFALILRRFPADRLLLQPLTLSSSPISLHVSQWPAKSASGSHLHLPCPRRQRAAI
jgi:hypothetical protein